MQNTDIRQEFADRFLTGDPDPTAYTMRELIEMFDDELGAAIHIHGEDIDPADAYYEVRGWLDDHGYTDTI
jgi:hypothetical protein